MSQNSRADFHISNEGQWSKVANYPEKNTQ